MRRAPDFLSATSTFGSRWSCGIHSPRRSPRQCCAPPRPDRGGQVSWSGSARRFPYVSRSTRRAADGHRAPRLSPSPARQAPVASCVMRHASCVNQVERWSGILADRAIPASWRTGRSPRRGQTTWPHTHTATPRQPSRRRDSRHLRRAPSNAGAVPGVPHHGNPRHRSPARVGQAGQTPLPDNAASSRATVRSCASKSSRALRGRHRPAITKTKGRKITWPPTHTHHQLVHWPATSSDAF